MPSRRTYLRSVGGAVTVGALAGCSGLTGGGGEGQITFGAVNPLSGPAGFFGELISDIQGSWQQRVNEDGGLNVAGEQLEVAIEEYDSETSNEGVRSGIENAVNVDNVDMVLSVFRTGGSLTAAPILNENEIPGITHGFTPRINEEGNYLLRWTTSTLMHAYPYLTWISESDDIETVGYLVEEGEFGDDALRSVDYWFREADNPGDYVQLGRFPRSQQDFSSFISEASNAYDNGDIDAVIIDTWATPLQLFLEQQGQRGLNEQMPVISGVVGGDWTPNIGELGSAMDNVYHSQVYARPEWADNEAISQTLPGDFDERASALEGLDLETQHPVNNLFYSELIGIEQAFQNAESASGPDLRASLVENELETLVGPITINNKGQGAVNATLSRFSVEDGDPAVTEVPFSGEVPAITSIPPEVDL